MTANFTRLLQHHTSFVGYNEHVDWRYDVTFPRLPADAGYHIHCVGKQLGNYQLLVGRPQSPTRRNAGTYAPR